MKKLAPHIARIKSGYAGTYRGQRDQPRDAGGRFYLCPDCDNTGIVDIETGGGNTREAYCECEIGKRRLKISEWARDSEIDRRIDERQERGIR